MRSKRVALLIEATNAYARGLLHGIARFNHEHPRWVIYFEPHGLGEPLPRWLKNWDGDGILARLANRRTARAVLGLGVPLVELRRIITIPGVPSIGPDNQKVAALAFEHFRERGFQHFGLYEVLRNVDRPLNERSDAFLRQVRASGFFCHVFKPERSGSLESEQMRLAQWLRRLPKPVGVLTCNDNYGLQVLRASLRAGVMVPEEVAVLSAGNDDCLCDLCHPPLSSVDLAPELIGYEAAALLDRMMSGKRPPSQRLEVAPKGIVTRLSTDVLATPDPAVARTVAFIRENACGDLRVGDVLRHVGLSRSALEPKMKTVLGRTIHREIRRVQLERVRSLLSSTDVPIKQIATRTGFRNVQYLARVFRKETGHTLAGYRKRMRWQSA
ncbi:MAG TPA: DNA-binding transcriptional regulator [Verrucomicrobiae bacterium]|nr:DNA-binding transcriptional regulator [Verrucomicrobiae bacterium]